jgi:small-conductance mechanosensitive channel
MMVVEGNSACLEEPKPLFIFQGFDESSLRVQFSVRTARENYLQLRDSMAEQIIEAFNAAGIEIPFPHRTSYSGSVMEPYPVRVLNEIP